MDTKWTPGEWSSCHVDERYYVAAPRPGNEARLDDVLSDPNAGSNANLIAAAPDLYEALYDLVDSFDEGSVSYLLERCRAALAKATGETA